MQVNEGKGGCEGLSVGKKINVNPDSPGPLSVVVVHLEVHLGQHRDEGVVRLPHVLYVLRQLDGHYVTKVGTRVVCNESGFVNTRPDK